MYELFFQNIEKHIHLDSTEKEGVREKLKVKILAKGQLLLKQGNYCKDIYFVNNGCLRIFQNHEDGTFTNILFCPEFWWACDIISFSTGVPSSYAIAALEQSEVFYLSAVDLEELYFQIPKLERFFRILFQNGFALYQSRLTLALNTSAEYRYKLFETQYPSLINKISQKHIASYLGITPVFLSIIRKRKSL